MAETTSSEMINISYEPCYCLRTPFIFANMEEFKTDKISIPTFRSVCYSNWDFISTTLLNDIVEEKLAFTESQHSNYVPTTSIYFDYPDISSKQKHLYSKA